MKPLAAVVCLLAMVGVSNAQCYSVGGCYNRSSYSYYTVPYVAPQTYVTPHYDYYTQTAVVGKAYPVYLPLLSYTSLADDVRSYYTQKRVLKEGYLEALREAAAEGIFSGTSQPFGPVPNPPPGVESKAPPSPPAGLPPPEPPKAPPAKKGQVSIGRLLQTKCASCHNSQQPDRVDLTGDPNKIPGFVRDKCVVLTSDRSMPMKGDKLTQEEFDVVQAWAKSVPLQITKAIPAASDQKIPEIPKVPPADRK